MFRNLLGFIRLNRACSESETNRVRSDAKIAAMMSSDGGPPIMIGAPLGNCQDDRRWEANWLRAAHEAIAEPYGIDPMTLTVFDPKTHTASSSGLIGFGGSGVSPGRITGLGVFGTGAQDVPGGKRMCPGRAFAIVHQEFVAGTRPNR